MGDIELYCGIGEKTFNHHPVHTGPNAFVSPVSGKGSIDKKTGKKRRQRRNDIYIPAEVKRIQFDSGVFSDMGYRYLTPEEGLERQLDFIEYLEERHPHSIKERTDGIVTYDFLVDEQQDENGERYKNRLTPEMAALAVEKTIEAAEYLASKREYIKKRIGHEVRLIFGCQGSDSTQYIKCANAIIPYVKPGDVFGLGGWCILGVQHKYLPTFYETINEIIPMLKEARILRAHIFGCLFAQALGPLLFQCDHKQRRDGLWGWDEKTRIQLSADSVGPTTRITKELPKKPGFASWGYASWAKMVPLARVEDSCKILDENGNKAPACTDETYCRGLQRAKHVDETRAWLANFRDREAKHYHYVAPARVEEPKIIIPKAPYTQLDLFTVA